MNTCKTCKWWGSEYLGYCGFLGTVQSYRLTFEKRFEIVTKVLDDSGLEANLATGLDFGCIHHEEK